MKKLFGGHKFPLGHLALRVLLTVILIVIFGLVMIPFMVNFDKLSPEEAAKMGSVNLWRIVFLFGFFTMITIFITFWRKIFRLTAITLFLCWLVGTSFVVLMETLPTNNGQSNLPTTSQVPTFTGQEVFDAVNNYRKEKGVVELVLDQKLCNNLAQRYYDIKKGLDEGVTHKELDDWVKKYVEPFGNYNIQEDFTWAITPQEAIKAWEGSPGHRLSILDPKNRVGCSYAAEGYAIIILGYKQANVQQTATKNQNPSRTGRIISYHEWCTNKDISIYENELITMRSSDGNIYSMPQGDWDCYENFLKNKR